MMLRMNAVLLGALLVLLALSPVSFALSSTSFGATTLPSSTTAAFQVAASGTITITVSPTVAIVGKTSVSVSGSGADPNTQMWGGPVWQGTIQGWMQTTANSQGQFSGAFVFPKNGGWEGHTWSVQFCNFPGCSKMSNQVSVRVDSDTSAQQYTITVNTSPAGLDSPTGGGAYNANTIINIGVGSVSGYTFVKWQRDGADYKTQTSFQYTVDASHTFTAIFQAASSSSITITVSPTVVIVGKTSVSVSGSGAGPNVQVWAGPIWQGAIQGWMQTTANSQGQFSGAFVFPKNGGWEGHTWAVQACNFPGCNKMSNQVSVRVDPDTSAQQYTITVNTSPAGLDSPQGGGTYAPGTSTTVSVGSASGYTFVKWQRDGADYVTQQSFTYTVEASHTFTAVFQQASSQKYTIGITTITDGVSGGGSITISGYGTYTSGQSLQLAAGAYTVTASPGAGKQFGGWSPSGAVSYANANSATTTATISGTATMSAKFVSSSCQPQSCPSGQQWDQASCSCKPGQAAFGFSVSNSGGISVTQGASASNTITTTLVSGSAQSISLSCSGLPSGASYTFNPASGTPSFQSTLTISASSSTPASSYTVTITGTGGGASRTTTFALTVSSGGSSSSVQTTPGQANYAMLIFDCPSCTTRRGELKVWIQQSPVSGEVQLAMQYYQNTIDKWNQQYPQYAINLHITTHVQAAGEAAPPDPSVQDPTSYLNSSPYDQFFLLKPTSGGPTGLNYVYPVKAISIIEWNQSFETGGPDASPHGWHSTFGTAVHEFGHDLQLDDIRYAAWTAKHPIIVGEIMVATPAYYSLSSLDMYGIWAAPVLHSSGWRDDMDGRTIYLPNNVPMVFFPSDPCLSDTHQSCPQLVQPPVSVLWGMCPNPRQPCDGSSTSFTLTVNTSPSGLASPSGGGSYTSGATVSISVGSVNGYTFQYWNRDGSLYTSSQSFTYAVDASHTFTAVFQQSGTSTCQPPTGGCLTGQTWDTTPCKCVSTAGTVKVTIYTATDGTFGGGSVTISGYDTYTNGQAVQLPPGSYTVTATPSSGMQFWTWTPLGAVTFANPSAASTTATISGTAVLYANFQTPPQQTTYPLTVSASSSGTISGTSSGSYAAGTSVSITATASSSTKPFSGWSISGASCSGGVTSNPCTFTMPSRSVSITANFGGTCTPPQGGCPTGQQWDQAQCKCVTSASQQYTIAVYANDNSVLGQDPSARPDLGATMRITYTSGGTSQDKTLKTPFTAQADQNTQFTVYYTTSPSGYTPFVGGEIVDYGNGGAIGTSATYSVGTANHKVAVYFVAVQAQPAGPYTFDKWNIKTFTYRLTGCDANQRAAVLDAINNWKTWMPELTFTEVSSGETMTIECLTTDTANPPINNSVDSVLGTPDTSDPNWNPMFPTLKSVYVGIGRTGFRTTYDASGGRNIVAHSIGHALGIKDNQPTSNQYCGWGLMGYCWINNPLLSAQIQTPTPGELAELHKNFSSFSTLQASMYTITVNTNPGGITSPTGGGTYNSGAAITISVNSVAGYTFQGWLRDGSAYSSQMSFQYTVEASHVFTANFGQTSSQAYTITVNTSPQGLDSPTGGGAYPAGVTIAIGVDSTGGYTFVKWQRDGADYTPQQYFSYTVDASHTFTAVFSQASQTQYTITVNTSPPGLALPTGSGTYNSGTAINIGVGSVSGYTFVKWQRDGADYKTQASFQYTVDASHTFTAVFSQASQTQYTITVNTSPSGLDSPTGGGAFPAGMPVAVGVGSVTGYTFVKWQRDGADYTSQQYFSYTVDASHTFTAVFSQASQTQYTITVNTNPPGLDSPQGGGTYLKGATAQISVSTVSGYTFTQWNRDGSVYTGSAAFSYVVDAGHVFTAIFQKQAAPQSYTITLQTDPRGINTPSGSGTYTAGAKISIGVGSVYGYTFVKWQRDGADFSTQQSFTYTVDAAHTFTAIFHVKSNMGVITVNTSPSGLDSPTGGGTFNTGISVAVGVGSVTGYTFVKWQRDGSDYTAKQYFSYTVDASHTFTAVFRKANSYLVIVNTNPSGLDNPRGGGYYLEGAIASICVDQVSGYTFTKWQRDGIDYTTPQCFSYTVDAPRTFTAVFQISMYTITVNTSPSGLDGPLGGGKYYFKDRTVISVSPVSGYSFMYWTRDGSVYSKDMTFPYTIDGSHAFTAVFQKQSQAPAQTAVAIAGRQLYEERAQSAAILNRSVSGRQTV